MSRKILIESRLLEAAKIYCLGKNTPKAVVSLDIINQLLKPTGKTAKDIANDAECSRPHALKVVRWIKTGALGNLAGNGSFRRQALLSKSQQKELHRKLGNELKCAKDVLAWYGKDAALAIVYGWCRPLGFSFRKGRSLERLRGDPRDLGGQQRAPKFELPEKTVVQLRSRQTLEREPLHIPPGELRDLRSVASPIRRKNPVLRIEVVIRAGTTGNSVSQIAADLTCSRSDVRKWIQVYKAEGVDRLCGLK